MTASNNVQNQRWAACPRIKLKEAPGAPRIFDSYEDLNAFLDAPAPIRGMLLPGLPPPCCHAYSPRPRIPSISLLFLLRIGEISDRRLLNRQNYVGVPVRPIVLADESDRVSTPSLRDHIRIDQLGSLPPFSEKREMNLLLEGHFKATDGTWLPTLEEGAIWVPDSNCEEFTCCLWRDWRFLEIERDAERRACHLFSGNRYKCVEEIIIRALFDLEDALFKIHPTPPARAVADFWSSFHIQSHIAKICRTLADPENLRSLAANTDFQGDFATELHLARINVYRRLLAVAHELSPEPLPEAEAVEYYPQSATCAELAPDSKATGTGGTAAGAPIDAADADIDARRTERKKLRDAYKAECKRAGVNLTDEMIARAASPPGRYGKKGWSSRTHIQKWLACNTDYSGKRDAMIRRVLREKPHLKTPGS